MAAMAQTMISFPKSLLDQLEILAQQLNVSQDRLFEMAVGGLIENIQAQNRLPGIEAQPEAYAATPAIGEERIVNQGDVFWIRPEAHTEAELGYYPHPYVVIQDNVINYSRINTLVVCGLTSNTRQAKAPGNVLLEDGEANLPKRSVIDVSKVSTVVRSQLGDHIGSLSPQRIEQTLAGMRFLQRAFFAR